MGPIGTKLMTLRNLTEVENESCCEFCYWNALCGQLPLYASWKSWLLTRLVQLRRLARLSPLFYLVITEIVSIVFTSNISKQELCNTLIFASCFIIMFYSWLRKIYFRKSLVWYNRPSYFHAEFTVLTLVKLSIHNCIRNKKFHII